MGKFIEKKMAKTDTFIKKSLYFFKKEWYNNCILVYFARLCKAVKIYVNKRKLFIGKENWVKYKKQTVGIKMRREIHVDSELNFTEIVGVLLSKLKLLICVLLAGCVLGGCLGIWRTYDYNIYGTSLVFFVNPSNAENEDENGGGVYGAYGKTLMATMMEFLSTEVFAEKVMTGMPDAPKQKTDENGNLTDHYKYYIAKIRGSIAFSCSNSSSTDSVEAETASSFVYVRIKVLGDGNKQFAKDLLSRIETEVPKEIEKEIHVPTGYTGTVCRLMTVDDEIKLLNPGYTKSTAIRYAALLGVASLLIAAVVVILVEKSDKRLKNLEFISKKLDLPILAIVPSIEMEEQEKTEVESK